MNSQHKLTINIKKNISTATLLCESNQLELLIRPKTIKINLLKMFCFNDIYTGEHINH